MAKKEPQKPQAPEPTLVLPFPPDADPNKPFVLLFAEERSVDVLSDARCVFSELLDGLTVTGSKGDQPCTTFGGGKPGEQEDSAVQLRT